MSGQDDRRCRRVFEFNNGWTAWQVGWKDGPMFPLPPGIIPTLAEPEPPTRKVVQRYYIHRSGEVCRTRDADKGQRVEWELCGSKIVGVRLVEDDE